MEKKKITTLYKLSNEEISLLKKKNDISYENNELKKMLAQQEALIQSMHEIIVKQKAEIQSMHEIIVKQKAELQSMREVIVQQEALLSKFQQSQNIQKISLETDAKNFEFTEDSTGNIVITKYIGKDTDVVIPKKINGKNVTQIGDYAFLGCDSLTSITIPDGVTQIGDYAFCCCDSLISITIPDGVTQIGDHAFQWCDSLISITIPDGVTQIGDCAFCRCDSLTSITIPDGVTQIGSDAFKNCPNLTIYGKMFSYAEKYAKQNNIKFKNY